MASLAFGTDKFFTLTKEGDTGQDKFWDGSVHAKSAKLASMRDATIKKICQELVRFNGGHIDLFIMAPGHGNLGALVNALRNLGAWPLRQEWHISIYSGSFNMRGIGKFH